MENVGVMKVSIKPLDTIFVRDGRAFGVNDAHAADSIFPPPPRVAFGAWRGAILAAGGHQFSYWGGSSRGWPGWFGDSNNAGALRQKGPALSISSEAGERLLFPLPLDAVLNQEQGSLTPLEVVKMGKEQSSLPLAYGFQTPADKRLAKPKEALYLTAKKLGEYLTGGKQALPLTKGMDYFAVRDLWLKEDRNNVGIDPDTYAHVQGRLFSLSHTRPIPGLSLFCDWYAEGEDSEAEEAANMVQSGSIRLLNLGGEKKAAEAAPSPPSLDWPPAPTLAVHEQGDKVCFSLYFATPAYFESGSWPAVDESGRAILQADAFSLEVEVLAAAVGKPFHLGGYDIARNRQRAVRRFVPAGSVYILRTMEPTDKVLDLHANNVGDDAFLRAQGFGLAFLGSLANRPLDKLSGEGG
jgi:CRISPR-associated protein Cmr3